MQLSRVRFVVRCVMLLVALLAAQLASIDPGVYPDAKAASAVWSASEKGCAPASVERVDGQSVLALKCNFAGTEIGRGSWDRAVTVPMAQTQGIEFEIECANTQPIASFSCYLQSGKGWYHGVFAPRYAKGWNRIVISRAMMKEDGKPGPWANIDKLRISAWRGGEVDTTIHVRNIRPVGVLGDDARVLMLVGTAGDKNVVSYGERLSKWMSAQGIGHATMRDDEVTAEDLKRAPVVMLAYNPKLPKPTAGLLASYLKSGGKLVSFYYLPSSLTEVTGIAPGSWQPQSREGQLAAIRCSALEGAPANVTQHSWALTSAKPASDRAKVIATWFDDAGVDTGLPAIIASDNTLFMTHVATDDDPSGHQRLLLAMLGRLDAQVWKNAVAARRERVGEIGTARTVDEIVSELSTSNNAEVKSRVAKAKDLIASIDTLPSAKGFDACAEAEQALREAFCIAQPAKDGEFRAFWCHSAFGVKGMTWDQAIARLKDSGFTAIMPNMLWGGTAFYQSEVLPVSAEVATKGDQIAECLAACKKHGLQCHVWKVDWNLGHEVPKAFVDKLHAEKRLQQSFSGEEQPWLCPSNPENVKLEHDALLEVVRKYDVDGIHFDYIRYPGADHCFCPPCRERFEKATGKPVVMWPKDVQMKGSRRDEWELWCQNNITTLVRSVSEDVHQLKPAMKVSAAVFRNWDTDRHWVMQDWKLWCERGYLDFVCPMDYTESDGTYEGWMKRQTELAGKAGLVPGIGASSSNVSLTADRVINQINLTRKYHTKGFIIFNYGEHEANTLLPMLKLGVTKP